MASRPCTHTARKGVLTDLLSKLEDWKKELISFQSKEWDDFDPKQAAQLLCDRIEQFAKDQQQFQMRLGRTGKADSTESEHQLEKQISDLKQHFEQQKADYETRVKNLLEATEKQKKDNEDKIKALTQKLQAATEGKDMAQQKVTTLEKARVEDEDVTKAFLSQIQDLEQDKQSLSSDMLVLKQDLEKLKEDMLNVNKHHDEEKQKFLLTEQGYQRQLNDLQQEMANETRAKAEAIARASEIENQMTEGHKPETQITDLKQYAEKQKADYETQSKQLKQDLEKEKRDMEDKMKELKEKLEKEVEAKNEAQQKVKLLESSKGEARDVTNEFLSQIQVLEQEKQTLSSEILIIKEDLKKANEDSLKENKHQQQEKQKFLLAEKEYQRQLKDLQHELAKEIRDKEEAITRANEVDERRLYENKSDTTNMNESNKPAEIGERFGKLYDNEFTKALENLIMTEKMEEREAIETLRGKLLDVYQFCDQISEQQRQNIQQAVVLKVMEDNATPKAMKSSDSLSVGNSLQSITSEAALSKEWVLISEDSEQEETKGEETLSGDQNEKENFEESKHSSVVKDEPADDGTEDTKAKQQGWAVDPEAMSYANMPDELKGLIKQLQKRSASENIKTVHTLYLSRLFSQTSPQTPTLCAYTQKCVELCWLMLVQDPALVMLSDVDDTGFDSNLWREYTRTGKTVEYVVWPSLFLHKEGPILAKGVVQFVEEETRANLEKPNNDINEQ